jgi:hypothetical protein
LDRLTGGSVTALVSAYAVRQSPLTSQFRALSLCRLPFATTWFEWLGSDPVYDPFKTDSVSPATPTPVRMGALVETDESRQHGVMSFAWTYRATGLSICPLAATFDWRENAEPVEDVELDAMRHAGLSEAQINHHILARIRSGVSVPALRGATDDDLVGERRRIGVVWSPVMDGYGKMLIREWAPSPVRARQNGRDGVATCPASPPPSGARSCCSTAATRRASSTSFRQSSRTIHGSSAAKRRCSTTRSFASSSRGPWPPGPGHRGTPSARPRGSTSSAATRKFESRRSSGSLTIHAAIPRAGWSTRATACTCEAPGLDTAARSASQYEPHRKRVQHRGRCATALHVMIPMLQDTGDHPLLIQLVRLYSARHRGDLACMAHLRMLAVARAVPFPVRKSATCSGHWR